MQETLKRKLTAILSADVAGYSKLMSDDEEATVHTLKSYRKVIESLINEHRGRLVDSPGDNMLAEFASVVDALRCAWDVQKEVASRNSDLAEKRRMTFRIGVNLGDVIEEEGRIYGDGVNVAARLESLAEAGGICISDTVFKHVKKKVSFRFEDQGEQSVKNIDEPVQVYRVVMESDDAPSETIQRKTKSKWKRNLAIAFGVLILLFAGTAAYVWNTYFRIPDVEVLTGQKDEFKLPEGPSIAVLPFDNLSGDPEQEYFSDGITEEIITALSKVPDMLVIASTSTFAYKGIKVKVQQIGKELGVRYVLEGNVRKAGDRIRVTAQLIDATTGNHLWADRYDRKLKDIFELQDELTTRILEELNVKLQLDVRARLKIKGPNNLEAYLKWWQGTRFFSRFNKDDNALARQTFEEVIKLDPNWGMGYAALGLAKLFDLLNGWSTDTKLCVQEAIKYSQKAISLDKTLPGPHVVMCYVNLLKKRYAEAITEAELAIFHQPNFFAGYAALGMTLVFSGNPQKAQEMFNKAIRFNPKFHILKFNLATTHFHLKQYPESIALLKTALQELPKTINVHAYLTASYILSGMEEEARKQAEKILLIDSKFSVKNYVNLRLYKNQSDKELLSNALRKAGLK